MSTEILPSSSQISSSNSDEISPVKDDTHASATKPSTLTMPKTDNTSAQALLKLVTADLHYIQQTCHKLKQYETHVTPKLTNASKKLPTIQQTEDDLRKFKKSIRKLKLPIPSKFNINYQELETDPNLHFNSSTQGQTGYNTGFRRTTMPNFYKNAIFLLSAEFQDFLTIYERLNVNLKLCLLCFSVFPEGAVIKKRLMVYWWMGEGFAATEELGVNLFNELAKTSLILPVDEKKSQFLEVASCKMHPFVRYAIITFAERANFFDFDGNESGSPSEAYASSLRSCLMGKGLADFDRLDNLHMLFNVNEAILEFKAEWFLKMRNVNVLYLGRWKASGKHHIEVEDNKFLEGLKYMTHLKFLSLQGVSRIIELPDSVSMLRGLTILDLRACHNLERIPKHIGELNSLTHLDMSECYLLDHMPKQLSQLKSLLVLKGFVVKDSKDKSSCTLDALAKLEKLRKLSIYTAMKEFPQDKHLIAFRKFKSLSKLTIAWGGGSNKAGNTVTSKSIAADPKTKQGKTDDKKQESKLQEANRGLIAMADNIPNPANVMDNKNNSSSSKPLAGLPEKLVKLDLQCFSGKVAPPWLNPSELKSLKKMYIRGGELHYLRRGQPKQTWNVEILCLKYLTELEMGWRELNKLFPKLVYMERVKCPKLTLFPCDEFGVWMKKTEIQH